MAEPERWTDDRALVLACKAGDAAAWEALVRRYRRLVYSIPSAYRMPPHDADEIFQRVALRLFENLGSLRDPDRLPAWLIVTTRRECHAHARGRSRWESLDAGGVAEPAADAPDVTGAIEAIAREHALSVSMDRLGEPCRGLLAALYIEEPTPSYEEIGRRLGRPVGSLGPTRRRCLDKLKQLYLDSGGESA